MKKKKKNLYYGGHKSLMVVGDRTLAGIRPSELPLSLSRPFFFGLYQNGSPSCDLCLFHSLPLNFKGCFIIIIIIILY